MVNDNSTNEQSNHDDDEIVSNVLSDIDKSEALNQTSQDVEATESDSQETEKDLKAETESAPTRHERNTAEKSPTAIRIQQLVDRAKIAEGQRDIATQKLEYANQKIADLENTVKGYEAVVSEIEALKHQILSDGSLNTESQKGEQDTNAPALSEEQLRQKFATWQKEQEEAKRAELDKAEAERNKLAHDERFKQMWEPHLKRVAQNGSDEMKAHLHDIVGILDSKKMELMGVIGKYQYAPEILSGLYKKPGFANLPLAEQIESAVKLNNKIIEAKNGRGKQEVESHDSAFKASASNQPTSYAEYLKAKYKK